MRWEQLCLFPRAATERLTLSVLARRHTANSGSLVRAIRELHDVSGLVPDLWQRNTPTRQGNLNNASKLLKRYPALESDSRLSEFRLLSDKRDSEGYLWAGETVGGIVLPDRSPYSYLHWCVDEQLVDGWGDLSVGLELMINHIYPSQVQISLIPGNLPGPFFVSGELGLTYRSNPTVCGSPLTRFWYANYREAEYRLADSFFGLFVRAGNPVTILRRDVIDKICRRKGDIAGLLASLRGNLWEQVSEDYVVWMITPEARLETAKLLTQQGFSPPDSDIEFCF